MLLSEPQKLDGAIEARAKKRVTLLWTLSALTLIIGMLVIYSHKPKGYREFRTIVPGDDYEKVLSIVGPPDHLYSSSDYWATVRPKEGLPDFHKACVYGIGIYLGIVFLDDQERVISVELYGSEDLDWGLRSE